MKIYGFPGTGKSTFIQGKRNFVDTDELIQEGEDAIDPSERTRRILGRLPKFVAEHKDADFVTNIYDAFDVFDYVFLPTKEKVQSDEPYLSWASEFPINNWLQGAERFFKSRGARITYLGPGEYIGDVIKGGLIVTP